MALERYTCNTGTPGQTLTLNGGINDSPLTAVSVGLVYDASGSHGQGARSTATSGQNGTITVTRTASPIWSLRLYFEVPNTISGDCRLAYVNASGVRAASIMYHSTNTFRVYDSTSTITYKWASSALTKGSMYCVCLSGNRNTGTLKVAYYLLGQSNPVESTTLTSVNLLATDADTIIMGKATAAVTTSLLWDEFAWDFNSDEIIGPENSPPTISISSSNGVSVIDAATNTTSGNGTSLTYGISPSPLLTLSPGKWVVQQTTSEQTFTVTVTQSGVNYTQQVVVPALAQGGDTIYLPSMLVKTS